jgi:phage/plasmid-like protein (TIGR03299 family)
MPANVEKMVYAGNVPWHGIGKKVDGLMTSEEAIKAAEMDWEVALEPVTVRGHVMDEYKAIVRQSDHSVFAIVGNRYTPIQNREAFKFFDAVVGGGAYFETAGSLNGGRRIWMLANLNSSIGVKGDEVKKYVVLSNSHDGSLARQMFLTPIRVVCENTLQMALNSAVERVYARHTARANSAEKVQEAKVILHIAETYFTNFKEMMDLLAVKQLPAGDQPLLLAAAFGTHGAIAAEEVYNPIKIQMDKVQELITVDRKEFSPELHGTVYEAYNAVVKFTDYYRNYRGGQPDNRLNGVWFGGGNIIKNRALDWAIKYSK